MKHFTLSLVVAAMLVMVSMFASGCGKSPVAPQAKVVSGVVYDHGMPTQHATVMICFPGDSTLNIQTNQDGSFQAEIPSDLSVKAVLAVALGKAGMTEVENRMSGLKIDMSAIVQQRQVVPTNATSDYWFGVYSTDGNGDVKFRYQFAFSRFTCINYLPWLFESTNPNSWLSWDLTDFPSPWKGKFLAVPRRYQDWHKWVYGYPIQQALYLIASR